MKEVLIVYEEAINTFLILIQAMHTINNWQILDQISLSEFSFMWTVFWFIASFISNFMA
jgi:hypothetical protein